MSYADFMTVELARKETTTTMLPAQSTGVGNENTIDVESNSDNSPPATIMESQPPIHLLPNELLVKVIDKLPRTQWPDMELIDRKFHDAVLLAWSSVREVDIERDFIYAESETIEDDDYEYVMIDDHYEMEYGPRLRRQIARKTEAILKKLSERSPFITSLSGLSFMCDDDPTLNTTAVRYLAGFDRLESIKVAEKYYSSRFVNGREFNFSCDIPLISFIEFMESTQSRGTLKEIEIQQCHIPNDPIIVANFDQRLRAGFSNVSNDPTRQLLQLESFSMGEVLDCRHTRVPLTFLDGIDGSRMTKLSLGDLDVDPAALTTLINGAPQLQHLDFAFLSPCYFYDSMPECQGGHLQSNKDLLAVLESHQQLTSLGFERIWGGPGMCACFGFETEFKNMLRTIGPQLWNLVFKPNYLPPDSRMGEIRDIIQHHMPCLKSIELSGSCAADPEDLLGIADGKELEEIEIAPYTFANSINHYWEILDDVLSTVINKSPRLKRFNGVNYHPDQRVAAELCKLSDLNDLRIGRYFLTNENFIAISQVCAEKLEVLHLRYYIEPGVEIALIEFIGKATPLRELMVEGNVTDRLLECLAESCPNLEKFSASRANGITFGGVQMFLDRCPKLRWLDVDNSACTFKRSLKNLKLDRYRKLESKFE